MQFTRERILNILKERGQATVDELSEELELTAVTVRHHLDILRGDGFVAAPLIHRRKRPGRPQYLYTLTNEASALFPKRYEHLASLILDEVRSYLSPTEMQRMLTQVGERIAEQADLPPGDGLETRLSAVTEFLDDLGYMACWESNGGEYLLHIANCPYEQVARQDRQVCTIDMAMLTSLLGVTPERISWTARGDQRCTYAILES